MSILRYVAACQYVIDFFTRDVNVLKYITVPFVGQKWCIYDVITAFFL